MRDRARQNMATLMPDAVEVWRVVTSTPTEDFGTDTSLEPINTVLGNWWAVGSRESYTLSLLQVKADGIVAMPYDPTNDVSEKDELLYTVAETGDIHHFIIEYVFERSQGLDLRVAVTEYKFQQPT